MCSSLEELDGLVGGCISPKLWEEIEALNPTELKDVNFVIVFVDSF